MNNMRNGKARKGVDRSSLDGSKYPTLTRLLENQPPTKPLQIGTVWPTMVNKKLVLVVPEGGKCGVCDTDLSNKIALYIFSGKCEGAIPQNVTAVVAPHDVDDNVICNKSICLKTGKERTVKRRQVGDKAALEYTKFVSNGRLCDNCLKCSPDSHRCTKCWSAQYCSKDCLREDRKFHKKVCDKRAGDEDRKMPGDREQKKAIKKQVEALLEKCANPGCINRGSSYYYCKRCQAVAYCSANCRQLDLTGHKEACDNAVRRR